MDNKQGILHLVHGTFARDAKWIHPDSPLAQTIGNSLGGIVQIEPFIWSGDNSHKARKTAGSALAKKIRGCNRSNPGTPQYIVAHSHGGNVAAYALSDGNVSANVAGVACLGTPFIKARPRDLLGSRRLLQSILFSSMLIAVLLMVGIVRQGFTILVDQHEFEQQMELVNENLKELRGKYDLFKNLDPKVNQTLYKSQGARWYFTGFYTLFAIGIGWLMIKTITKLWNIGLKEKLPKLGERQSALTSGLTAEFGNTPLLVIDARGDEAAWWLTTVNRIASLPYRIWKPSNFILAGLAVISCLLLVPLYFEIETSFSKTQMLIFMALLFFSLSTLSVYATGWAFCLLWPALFRSHALGFGKDDFLQNFIVEITSSKAPENATRASRHTATVHGKGLHHSRLYQDEKVLELIYKWFKNLQQQQIGPPFSHSTMRSEPT